MLSSIAILRAIILLSGASALAACGGGGSNDPDANDPVFSPTTSYERIDSTNAVVSTLGGGLIANGASLTAEAADGTIDHREGTFDLSNPGAPETALDSDSGFNVNGNYTFATDISTAADDYIGIIGVQTDPADIPGSGTATFSGEFEGVLLLSGATTPEELNNWESFIEANFAAGGTVNAEFTGSSSPTINRIEVTGATISGADFSGGMISTSNNAGVNDITGNSVDFDGSFFGYDTAVDQPAEVGGALVSEDSGNLLYGIFVAN